MALGLVLLLMAAGCSPRAYRSSCMVDRSTARQAAAQNDALSLTLLMKDAEQARINDLSRPLHTGDGLALVVGSNAPRYLYFVNLAPDGTRQLLGSSGQRGGDGAMRIPENGWLRLAGESGVELLAIVATREPVASGHRGKRRLFRLVEQSDRRGNLVKLQSAEPPDFTRAGYATMGVRAPSLALDGETIRIPAENDATVVLIDIDHRPR